MSDPSLGGRSRQNLPGLGWSDSPTKNNRWSCHPLSIIVAQIPPTRVCLAKPGPVAAPSPALTREAWAPAEPLSHPGHTKTTTRSPGEASLLKSRPTPPRNHCTYLFPLTLTVRHPISCLVLAFSFFSTLNFTSPGCQPRSTHSRLECFRFRCLACPHFPGSKTHHSFLRL